MPWEKTFDEDKAIEAAMLVFWEKGYTDTSMADLLKATGLTKGSFYNAFGSKHDLFVKALLKYDVSNRRVVLQELVAMDSPIESIEAFMNAVVNESADDSNKKGCFLVNTSLDLNSHEEQVKQIITSGFAEVETFFKQMIELGQLRKDIPESIDPKSTAKALMGTVAGIRVLGRGVYDKAALQALSEQSLRLIH